MIVDASALIECLLQTVKGTTVERHMLDSDDGLDAPHLVDVETTQALRRLVSRKELGEDRAAIALDLLTQFPVRRHAHTTLLPRLWRLRNTFSAYDAVYVALAESLGAPLLTCDVRLSKAAGGLVEITVV